MSVILVAPDRLETRMSGHYEREFCNLAYAEGFHVFRAPASGGGTARDLPDLAAAKAGERPRMYELKTTSDNRAYYGPEEVSALKRVASAFHARPRLLTRFKGDRCFYEFKIEDAPRTESGNYTTFRGEELSVADRWELNE